MQQVCTPEGVVGMREFLAMVFAKSADIILKSKGVYYTPMGGDPTAVAFHPELYGENLARHHPFDIDYGNVHPETGEYGTLTHHPAGMHGIHEHDGRGIEGFEHLFGSDERGNGRTLFPVEAVVKGISDFIREKGYTHDQYGRELIGESGHGIPFDYHLAMEAVQRAIELFNERHSDPEHHLPPLFDDNGTHDEWRNVIMGAFPKGDEGGIVSSDMMPTRDANGNLITFYMNSGTAIGEPERGPYPESGAVPFYKELKEVLNEMLGRGMSMNFVHQPYIEPHMMNPLMSREGSTEGQRGKRTMTPAQERTLAEQSHYGAVAPEHLVAHHPDAFFRIPTVQDKGGRPSAKTVEMLAQYNAALRLGLNEQQIYQIARAPISALLTPGKKLASGGSYIRTYDHLGKETGFHPGKPIRFGLWKRGKVGTPEELAEQYAQYKNDPEQWEHGVGEGADQHEKHHSHARRHSGEGYGQGTMSSTRNSLALFGAAHEHGIDLNEVWNNTHNDTILEGTPAHVSAQQVRQIYEAIAAHRIANNPKLQALSPIDFTQGHPEQALNTPTLPREWRSNPSAAVLSTHASIQPVQPQPQEPQVAYADPGQLTLDNFTQDKLPDLFQYSKDRYTESELRLLKAMEDIQMKEASKNPEVIKMLPRQKMNRDNPDDLTVMAHKFGLTPGDIYSITETQGDWLNIAKTLSVAPTVVSSVKVAFGGII